MSCVLLPPSGLYPLDPETFWNDFVEGNYIIEETVSEEQLEFLREHKDEVFDTFLRHSRYDGNSFATLEKTLKIVYNSHLGSRKSDYGV